MAKALNLSRGAETAIQIAVDGEIVQGIAFDGRELALSFANSRRGADQIGSWARSSSLSSRVKPS
jgi:predicted RNA-binding protein with PUA domain